MQYTRIIECTCTQQKSSILECSGKKLLHYSKSRIGVDIKKWEGWVKLTLCMLLTQMLIMNMYKLHQNLSTAWQHTCTAINKCLVQYIKRQYIIKPITITTVHRYQ